MANIFEECKNLKAKLDSLRPLSKADELRIMQKFRLDWNYHSNHLEGNSLTYGETKALILFGITAQGKPLKDHFEVTGHNNAVNWVLSIVKEERPLNESFIRELHKLILKESYKVDAITPEGQPTKKTVRVGEYKTESNHVKTKTGEIFRFASPAETPILMNELILWYNKKSTQREIDPILVASEFHYRYIRIHPFDDGNGRTARILMNFILLRFGYPPVIIKTEDKLNYFAALRQADAGLLQPFIEYIGNNLKQSLEIMISGAKGEPIEEDEEFEKEIALLEQSVNAVGKPIKFTKDRDILHELYDGSIFRCSNMFYERCKLMDRFYFETNYTICFDSSKNGTSKKHKTLIRSRISDETKNMLLRYKYDSFNQVGFDEFKHQSTIKFLFEFTKYIVENDSDVVIEKLYGENLTEKEITSLVDGSLKKHKETIQSKVDTLRNK